MHKQMLCACTFKSAIYRSSAENERTRWSRAKCVGSLVVLMSFIF